MSKNKGYKNDYNNYYKQALSEAMITGDKVLIFDEWKKLQNKYSKKSTLKG